MFFYLLLVAVVTLYSNLKWVFPGKCGKLFALCVLLCIFLGLGIQETVPGGVLITFFAVWMCQALWMFILFDVVRLFRFFALCRKMTAPVFREKRAVFVRKGSRVVLLASVALALLLIAVGVPHNDDFKIRTLDMAAPQTAYGDCSQKSFTAVFFSDIHFAPLFRRSKLERLIHQVDSIGPDYILFGGDIADVPTTTLDEWGFDSLMTRLAKSAKVASVAINGNHEALQERNGSNALLWLGQHGWVALDDSTVCFSSACFTGRTDFLVARNRESERKPLGELVPSIFKTQKSDSLYKDRPWFVLDHQPKGIEPGYSGILPDYAFSGHTHDGQFFPGNLIIGFVWRLAYGIGALDGVSWLVSSGFDSWGPPVRVGSDTELWVLRYREEACK